MLMVERASIHTAYLLIHHISGEPSDQSPSDRGTRARLIVAVSRTRVDLEADVVPLRSAAQVDAGKRQLQCGSKRNASRCQVRWDLNCRKLGIGPDLMGRVTVIYGGARDFGCECPRPDHVDANIYSGDPALELCRTPSDPGQAIAILGAELLDDRAHTAQRLVDHAVACTLASCHELKNLGWIVRDERFWDLEA